MDPKKHRTEINRFQSQFEDELPPVSDEGFILKDFSELQEYLLEGKTEKDYAFVRSDERWDSVTMVSNSFWELVSKGVKWQDLSIAMLRVDSHDCTSRNASAIVPDLVLYKLEDSGNEKDDIMHQLIDLMIAYEGRDYEPSFSYATGEYVFKSLQNEVGKALSALYDNTLDQNDDWYAVDTCNRNFGRTLWSPCMVGAFDRNDPGVLEQGLHRLLASMLSHGDRYGIHLDCMGRFGYLGGELDCSRIEPDEYEELKEEYESKVARAKMEATPQNDDGITTEDELLSMLKNKTGAVFVRYSMDRFDSTSRTNEAWDMPAQSLKANSTDNELPPIRMVRVICYKGKSKESACAGIWRFPQFSLFVPDDERSPYTFRFRDTDYDDLTYSERCSSTMIEFFFLGNLGTKFPMLR